jgi:hypothetical protein
VPLVQVLHTDDELTRTNAAAVLGSLKDARAAAALAWHAKSDDSQLVRQAAADALDKLAPALTSIELATRDPMTLTLGLAERWLIGDPALLKPYDSAQVKWTWSDGSLHGEPILGGLYGLWLASATLEDGLAAGATDPARSFLAAVHAAMVAEIDGAADLDLDGDLLASAQAMLPGLEVQLALAGPDRGAGLSLLLDSNQGAAAKALIASMDRSPSEVTALRSALGEDDFGVSLAAALALGRQGVTAPNVVAHLGHALTTIPDRLAITIGDTGLTGQAGGWELLTSDQVAGGLARAKAFPPKDVIVVQDGLQDVTLDALVYGLLDDPRTADVPVIIATDDVDGVSALYGDKVAAVVARASWDDVRAAAGDPGSVQRAAMDNALAASQVLAGMPAAAVRAAGGPITQALTSAASDDVKAGVVSLAGMAGVTDAIPAVTALVMGGGSRDLQLASLTAAAHLWALAGGSAQADDALLAHLHELVGGDDAELALAAAAALGQLKGAGGPGMVSDAG